MPTSRRLFVSAVASFVLILLTATIHPSAQTATATIAAAFLSIAVAVNPVTNQVYAVNEYSSDAAVIEEQHVRPIPLRAESPALLSTARLTKPLGGHCPPHRCGCDAVSCC